MYWLNIYGLLRNWILNENKKKISKNSYDSLKCSIVKKLHSLYFPLLIILYLETSEQRHLRLDLYFLYKLFVRNINSPDLLSHFLFHITSIIRIS